MDRKRKGYGASVIKLNLYHAPIMSILLTCHLLPFSSIVLIIAMILSIIDELRQQAEAVGIICYQAKRRAADRNRWGINSVSGRTREKQGRCYAEIKMLFENTVSVEHSAKSLEEHGQRHVFIYNHSFCSVNEP